MIITFHEPTEIGGKARSTLNTKNECDFVLWDQDRMGLRLLFKKYASAGEWDFVPMVSIRCIHGSDLFSLEEVIRTKAVKNKKNA